MPVTKTSSRRKVGSLRPADLNLEWRREAAQAFDQDGYPDVAAKLRLCHDRHHFIGSQVCLENPHHRRTAIPYSCNLPICPTCSWHRANARARRLAPLLHERAHQGLTRYFLRLVTLTTPFEAGNPDMADYFEHGWTALDKTVKGVVREMLPTRLSLSERKKGRVSLKAHGVGYIAGAEWGDDGGKLHFHGVYYGPYVLPPLLSDLWTYYTHGLATHVDVKPIKDGVDNIERTIAYAGKLCPIPPTYAPWLYDFLYHRRRVRAGGILFGAKAPQRRVDHSCPDCGSLYVFEPNHEFVHPHPASGS